MSATGRAIALVIGALLLVGGVMVVQEANGGGNFEPLPPRDPCGAVVGARGPLPDLEAVGERLVLIAVDRAACDLDVSRERLILGLAEDPEAYDAAPALKRGLKGAIELTPLPRVSEVLPDVLDESGLPGLAQGAIERIPDGVVDDLLPTKPLLVGAIDRLDVQDILDQLDDPSNLEPLLRDAILEEAREQIVSRLNPFD